MACTWGSTAVKVLVEASYQPEYAPPNLVEIPILGDPAALDTPASVIQTNGRNRKTVSFTGYVSAIADYNTLTADCAAFTERDWTGPDGQTMAAYITSLGPAEFIQSDCIKFPMSLMEA
jgi:hypothetical protein